jgi:uncharacterized protein (TIGR02996 family)
MHDDGFIQTIQHKPGDDASRLVYADWLDEQGDPISAAKSEFLRVTVELATSGKPKEWKKAQRKRLQELAAKLDTDWLAVVSRLTIENCVGKRRTEETRPLRGMRLLQFEFLCDLCWEDLQPTEEGAVRRCEACEQHVHYCDTITEARQHAQQGHCIAVDLGVIRRERDLEPKQMWLGRPSAETLREEEERVKPDPVSAERERRKGKK